MKIFKRIKNKRRLVVILSIVVLVLLIAILALRNSRTLAVVSGLTKANDNGKAITDQRETQSEATDDTGDEITSQRESRTSILDEDGTVRTSPVPSTNINVLLIGPDVGEANYDTLMIASLDLENQQVTLINIPRDIYVPYSDETIESIRGISSHYGRNSALNKINAAHSLGKMLDWELGTGPFNDPGIDFTADVVSELFKVYIDDYLYIKPSSFREIIDAFGGVRIDVPYRMLYNDPTQDLHINLQPGLQLLDGTQSEGFCRFRKGYTDSGKSASISDNERKANQVAFMKAFAEQHFSLVNIGKFISILENADNYIGTSIDNDRLSSYASYARAFAKSSYSIESIEVDTAPFDQGGVSFLRMLTGDDTYDSSNPASDSSSGGSGAPAASTAATASVETTDASDATGSDAAVGETTDAVQGSDPSVSDPGSGTESADSATSDSSETIESTQTTDAASDSSDSTSAAAPSDSPQETTQIPFDSTGTLSTDGT